MYLISKQKHISIEYNQKLLHTCQSKIMDLLRAMSYYVEIFMLIVLSLDSLLGLLYTIEPQYINIGDSLQYFCEFQTDDPSIYRNDRLCLVNCMQQSDGCQLYRQGVHIDCTNDHIQINITQAQESDFGKWKCSADDSVSQQVQKYGKYCSYFNTNVIKSQ